MPSILSPRNWGSPKLALGIFMSLSALFMKSRQIGPGSVEPAMFLPLFNLIGCSLALLPTHTAVARPGDFSPPYAVKPIIQACALPTLFSLPSCHVPVLPADSRPLDRVWLLCIGIFCSTQSRSEAMPSV